MSKTSITVTRDSEDDIKIRDLLVSIDSVEVTNLQFGHTLQQEVLPGPHTISVSNRLTHQELPFEAVEGHDTRFQACNHNTPPALLAIGVLGVVPYRAEVAQVSD